VILELQLAFVDREKLQPRLSTAVSLNFGDDDMRSILKTAL
jgi:hypothetical protein